MARLEPAVGDVDTVDDEADEQRVEGAVPVHDAKDDKQEGADDVCPVEDLQATQGLRKQ